MLTTKTVDIQIEEPPNRSQFSNRVTNPPRRKPNHSITIENTATVTYTVTLAFTLNDTAYQTNYVTFSNQTYTIHPGTNNITAWMLTSAGSPRTHIQITTQFSRN